MTAEGRESDPIVMETIVAPRTVGAHEAIANARVRVAAYEAFGAASNDPLPSLRLVSDVNPTVRSRDRSDVQVFADIAQGNYTIELQVAGGWVILPDDVLSGATSITAIAGATADSLVRVYQPASLDVTVVDAETGDQVTDPSIVLTRIDSGIQTAPGAGVTRITDLVPDIYDVTVSAFGYSPTTVASVTIPSGYPTDMSDELTVALEPFDGAMVTVTVVDHTGRPLNRADVEVNDPVLGLMYFITGSRGEAMVVTSPGETATITATSNHGHTSDTATVDSASQTSVTLTVGQGSGKGTILLSGGSDGTFVYRPWGGDAWFEVTPNANGEATIVVSRGYTEVGKQCASGRIVDAEFVYVREGRTRSETMTTSC